MRLSSHTHLLPAHNISPLHDVVHGSLENQQYDAVLVLAKAHEQPTEALCL